MCGLKKCCVNCKYYEHIRELDNEVDWCHYPNQEGVISHDPEYIKSELSGECEHYEQLEYKQYIAPSRQKSELKVGDRVYVSKTEGKASYGYILYCKGTIKDITFEPFYNRTTYKVKIDDKINKYQEDGLFIFHKSKSLINVNQCENRTIKVEVNKTTSKPQQEPTRIKPDIWYIVDDDSKEMFIEDVYAAYTNLCNNRETPHESLKQFKTNYQLKVGKCYKLNSNTLTLDYCSKDMREAIDYKQLIKEINEKIARKIMMNSIYGKAAFDNDPICTEPSIVDQYINKKRATYEREREDTIQKVYDASPIGKAINNFIAALKKAGLKDEMLPNFNMLWNDNCLTDAEKATINEIHTAYHLAMTKLHEKCRECVAILVNCETFEQKMIVLQKYDIIDSDYKLKA